MTNTAQTGFESERAPAERRYGFTRWSAWEIGATVAGFVVFWPLGLLAMFLKWKNGEMWRGSAEKGAPWAGFKAPDISVWKSQASSYGFAGSGNAAFDAYKQEQLRRLDEERRRLEEDQKAFREFVEKVRRAKDQEEFDRFMADRNMPQSN